MRCSSSSAAATSRRLFESEGFSRNSFWFWSASQRSQREGKIQLFALNLKTTLFCFSSNFFQPSSHFVVFALASVLIRLKGLFSVSVSVSVSVCRPCSVPGSEPNAFFRERFLAPHAKKVFFIFRTEGCETSIMSSEGRNELFQVKTRRLVMTRMLEMNDIDAKADVKKLRWYPGMVATCCETSSGAGVV